MRHARLSFRLAAARRQPPWSSPTRPPSPPPLQTCRTRLGVIGFGGAAAIARRPGAHRPPGNLVGFPMPASHAGTVHVFGRSGDRLGGERDAGREGRHAGGRVRHRARRREEPPGRSVRRERPAVARSTCSSAGRMGVGVERARLTAAGGAEGDRLGASIALHGGVLLAGAPGREGGARNGRRLRAGAGAPANGRRAGLVQATAAAAGDWFGAALAFDGQRALVGAPGGTAVALDSTRLRRRDRPSSSGRPAASGARRRVSHRRREDGHGSMGVAVLLDGTEALVGAPRVDSLAGVVVRYRRDRDTTWTSAGTIAPDSTLRPAGFGSRWRATAATSWSERPLVNMSAGDGPRVPARGRRSGRQEQLLVTPPAGYSTRLGAALAASDGLAVAGAPLADFFEGTGLLYQRDGAGGSWRETAAVTDTISARPPRRGRWRR